MAEKKRSKMTWTHKFDPRGIIKAAKAGYPNEALIRVDAEIDALAESFFRQIFPDEWCQIELNCLQATLKNRRQVYLNALDFLDAIHRDQKHGYRQKLGKPVFSEPDVDRIKKLKSEVQEFKGERNRIHDLFGNHKRGRKEKPDAKDEAELLKAGDKRAMDFVHKGFGVINEFVSLSKAWHKIIEDYERDEDEK